MKTVQQKIYHLGTKSGNKINKSDSLFVCINGNKTDIPLQSLFESYKQGEEDIKGHTFLGEFPIVDYDIVINEDIRISAYNKNSDEEVFITKVSYPLIQMGDKDTNESDKVQHLISEYQRMKLINKEPVIEVSEGENEFEAEEENEVEVQNYNEDIKELIGDGFKEFKDQNYRLLYNKEKAKGLLFLVKEDLSYDILKYEIKKKSDDIIDLLVKDNAENVIFDLNPTY